MDSSSQVESVMKINFRASAVDAESYNSSVKAWIGSLMLLWWGWHGHGSLLGCPRGTVGVLLRLALFVPLPCQPRPHLAQQVKWSARRLNSHQKHHWKLGAILLSVLSVTCRWCGTWELILSEYYVAVVGEQIIFSHVVFSSSITKLMLNSMAMWSYRWYCTIRQSLSR